METKKQIHQDVFYKRFIQVSLTLSILFVIAFVLRTCPLSETQKLKQNRDTLPDTLEVLTTSGASTMYIYRGDSLGYQYELLKLFAQEMGKSFRLREIANLDSIHMLIKRGEADLCIRPEALSMEGKDAYAYVGPEESHSIVLVQSKRSKSEETPYLNNVTDLIGRTIYVEPYSRCEQRLHNLNTQLGGGINIVPVADSVASAEDLLELVATCNIDYALVDEVLAKAISRHFPSLDTKVRVGFKQSLRWICNKDRKALADSLNSWAERLSSKQTYKSIYRRYFVQHQELDWASKVHNRRGEMNFVGQGNVSPYDSLFMEMSKGTLWQWEVLAAIAFQESRFNASIVGWSGARGLMGIMPRTGRIYGASKSDLLEPRTSIRVSLACLRDTEKLFFNIKDSIERQKFVLAGYNAGAAHIQDAQRLAKKYIACDSIWDGKVDKFILLKSKAKYYNDPECRYGYLRGRETYNYVREVLARAKFYRERVERMKK